MKNFKTDNTKKDFYKNALIGAGISLIITALIFVLMAVLMIVFDIGNAYASPLSFAGQWWRAYSFRRGCGLDA